MARGQEVGKPSKTKQLIRLVVGSLVVLIAYGIASNKPDRPPPVPSPPAKTQASLKVTELEQLMNAGKLRLAGEGGIPGSDVSVTLDVMGRSADRRELRGNERRFVYDMTDGSTVVFVFVPRKVGKGLELYYVSDR